MQFLRKKFALTVLAATALVAGCGGAKVNRSMSGASLGQELADLKKAYDAGIIDQKEYERVRRRILSARE